MINKVLQPNNNCEKVTKNFGPRKWSVSDCKAATAKLQRLRDAKIWRRRYVSLMGFDRAVSKFQ